MLCVARRAEFLKMGYRILSDEAVLNAVRRIAGEQIDNAISEIQSNAIDDPESVHQVRKRCKKIRGLIRLVRPRMDDTYQFENAWYRDAARKLSVLRDAHSMIGTIDSLMERFGDQVDGGTLARIGRQLKDRRSRIVRDEVDVRQRLTGLAGRMQQGRRRIDVWSFPETGFDAVSAGLAKTYSRGRKAMAIAYMEPSAERFHEWRKRTKYHWYHMRLLQSVWDKAMRARREDVHLLSEYLGDAHDLAILGATLRAEPDDFGDVRTVHLLLGLIDRRQAELYSEARPLGRRVFAEKPKHFVERLGTYWEARQSEAQREEQLSRQVVEFPPMTRSPQRHSERASA